MLTRLWCRSWLPVALASSALICLLVAGTAAWAVAQDESQPLINIQIRDATVREVLQMIARASGDIPIYITEDVDGKIPFFDVHDITAEAALQIICVGQNLYCEKRGNVYVVSGKPIAPEIVPAAATRVADATTPGQVVAQQPTVGNVAPPPDQGDTAFRMVGPGVGGAPGNIWESIACKNVGAGQMALVFGGSVYNESTMGSIDRRNVRRNGSLGSVDQGNLSDWAQIGGNTGGRGGYGGGGNTGGRGGYGGNTGGTGGNTGGFGGNTGGFGGNTGGRGGGLGGGLGGTSGGGTLSNLLPTDMQPPIAYMPLNTLLVNGTQAAIDKFREVLNLLDQPAKQVTIETKFVEVENTADSAFGIDWSVSNGTLEVFNLGYAPARAVNNVVRFSRGRFETELRVLQQSSRAQVINAPRVTTQNNLSAEVGFDTEIPYFSANITYNQFGQRQVDFTSDTVTVTNSLYVTPRINADDTITMDLQPEIDDQIGMVQGPNGEQLPIVSSQWVTTQVRVADGETLVIGGLIRKNQSDTMRATPLLSSLPIIGSLFRAKDTTMRHSELLIFVTPTIVRDVPPA